MRFQLLAGAAAIALGAASGASAQSVESGWYVAADAGYHIPKNIKATSSAGYDWTVSSDNDWAAFGRLGYRFNPNWRLEGEYGYRGSDIKSVRGTDSAAAQPVGLCKAGIVRTASDPTCQSPDGSIKAQTLMANVIYDFMPASTLRPFIGAGVGTAWVRNKAYGQLSGVPAGAATFQNTRFDDTDQALAYQGMLGVAWEMSPNWSLDLTGRYLATKDLQWGSVTQNAGPVGGGVTDVGSFKGKYEDASVTLGLRYTFGAPPAPPAAVAYEAREFVVYFPFDQSILTSEAQAVVQQAADYAKGGGATRITVTGHTDTSGSDKYNARLSERRGKAVADGLVGMGVAATSLAVDWKGESAPAVATGDGVKEPLNRRSAISITF